MTTENPRINILERFPYEIREQLFELCSEIDESAFKFTTVKEVPKMLVALRDQPIPYDHAIKFCTKLCAKNRDMTVLHSKDDLSHVTAQELGCIHKLIISLDGNILNDRFPLEGPDEEPLDTYEESEIKYGAIKTLFERLSHAENVRELRIVLNIHGVIRHSSEEITTDQIWRYRSEFPYWAQCFQRLQKFETVIRLSVRLMRRVKHRRRRGARYVYSDEVRENTCVWEAPKGHFIDWSQPGLRQCLPPSESSSTFFKSLANCIQLREKGHGLFLIDPFEIPPPGERNPMAVDSHNTRRLAGIMNRCCLILCLMGATAACASLFDRPSNHPCPIREWINKARCL